MTKKNYFLSENHCSNKGELILILSWIFFFNKPNNKSKSVSEILNLGGKERGSLRIKLKVSSTFLPLKGTLFHFIQYNFSYSKYQ